MNIGNPTALSASGDAKWQSTCAEYLLQHGVDVHTASSGRRAIDLMHKHRYDYIIADDSLADMSVLELSLYVPELTANSPILLVAASEPGRFKAIWDRCNAQVAGPRPLVLEALGEYMGDLNGIGSLRRPSQNVGH